MEYPASVLPKDGRPLWMQLGRYGDLLNILPLLQAVYPQHTLVHALEFTDLFELFPAVPNLPVDVAVTDLAAFLGRGIVSQVDRNPAAAVRRSANFALESWRVAGHPDPAEYHGHPLRLSLPWRPEPGRVLLNAGGVSSPFPAAAELRAWARQVYGERLVDVTDTRYSSFAQLAETLSRCQRMITTDTATLHLGYGFGIPTLCLTRDLPWYRSEQRAHWLAAIPYAQVMTRLPEIRTLVDGPGSCPAPAVRFYAGTYAHPVPARQAELDTCIRRMDKLAALQGVAGVRRVQGRPTYRAFFEMINQDVAGDPHAVSVVLNSDIWVDGLFVEQVLAHLKAADVWALTRWELKADGTARLEQSHDSQDLWAFRGPVRLPRYCDFPLGVPGCDNRISYELAASGYRVWNPCLDVRSYHAHRSQVRTWTEAQRIPRPYRPNPHRRIADGGPPADQAVSGPYPPPARIATARPARPAKIIKLGEITGAPRPLAVKAGKKPVPAVPQQFVRDARGRLTRRPL